jgi:adenosylmethionine-8-amino-7-oxononanoate aminotransferase
MEKALAHGLEPCRGLGGIVDVRTKGAIGVVQLARPPDRRLLTQAFVDAGAWVRPFGDIVYLTPALTMPADEVAHLCRTVVRVLTQ